MVPLPPPNTTWTNSVRPFRLLRKSFWLLQQMVHTTSRVSSVCGHRLLLASSAATGKSLAVGSAGPLPVLNLHTCMFLAPAGYCRMLTSIGYGPNDVPWDGTLIDRDSTFEVDWECARELDYVETADLLNPWNGMKSVRYSRWVFGHL